MPRSAILSPCRTWRYLLTRELYPSLGQVIINRTITFIGLNPSTADEYTNDPTIRRCMGFAKSFGGSKLLMVNLFAYRATDPKELLQVEDPIGPDNIAYIKDALRESDIVICAWGANPRVYMPLTKYVYELINEPFCLGVTKGGHPRHPLYIRADQKLIPYEWRSTS